MDAKGDEGISIGAIVGIVIFAACLILVVVLILISRNQKKTTAVGENEKKQDVETATAKIATPENQDKVS